ncbi:hypothetical protein [Saccharomonospora sp. CUA-673]|uniref:hypothetical protein n=1 Tax=Saccharomonospora sp. CUA-673 TaxID=1904969 RepID=UPI00111520C8|nr:hypothetical protein [Saccharomonospora sp. CUA-673]
MSGGHQVDPGKLGGAGGAYGDKGEELGQAAGNVQPGIGEGQIGQLWQATAAKYADAIDKYADAIKQYGKQVGELGGKFSSAAESYQNGETVNATRSPARVGGCNGFRNGRSAA